MSAPTKGRAQAVASADKVVQRVSSSSPVVPGAVVSSLARAGLANLYYGIDRQKEIDGFWGTQTLPFVDGASVGGYPAMETTVYEAFKQ